MKFGRKKIAWACPRLEIRTKLLCSDAVLSRRRLRELRLISVSLFSLVFIRSVVFVIVKMNLYFTIIFNSTVGYLNTWLLRRKSCQVLLNQKS